MSEAELFVILAVFGLLYVTERSVLVAVRGLHAFHNFIIIIIIIIAVVVVTTIIIIIFNAFIIIRLLRFLIKTVYCSYEVNQKFMFAFFSFLMCLNLIPRPPFGVDALPQYYHLIMMT